MSGSDVRRQLDSPDLRLAGRTRTIDLSTNLCPGTLMERRIVTSSVVRAIGYDAEARALEIDFHTGRRYRYEDVPAEIYAELVESDSIGSTFNECVRDAYPSKRVR